MLRPDVFSELYRPFHLAPWSWTLLCGLAKIAIALVALALPFAAQISIPIPITVGWLLALGGLTELVLAWRGRQSWVGRLTFASGAITLIAGAVLVESSWQGLFPLTQFMIGWLLLRGIVSLDVAILSRTTPEANWMLIMLRGATDIGLALLLVIGAPFSMFVVAVFGPTAEIVTAFFHVLALSFLVAGGGLVAIARMQRTRRLSDPFMTES